MSNDEKLAVLDRLGVPNCGNSGRTIFCHRFGDAVKVVIGCFRGTIDEAEWAILEKYNGAEAAAYIEKVKQAFDLFEKHEKTLSSKLQMFR